MFAAVLNKILRSSLFFVIHQFDETKRLRINDEHKNSKKEKNNKTINDNSIIFSSYT
jgi:hypothetical protein